MSIHDAVNRREVLAGLGLAATPLPVLAAGRMPRLKRGINL